MAVEIVLRLVAGMAADLSWRVEQRNARQQASRPRGGGAMVALLKKYGMVALAVALGVWATTIGVVLVVSGDDRAQGAVAISLGLLILGGLAAMHRGLRGARATIAVGAVGAGLISVWVVIPPIAAVAILVWLYETRELRQVPPQPA
jgi:hypothetical protein